MTYTFTGELVLYVTAVPQDDRADGVLLEETVDVSADGDLSATIRGVEVLESDWLAVEGHVTVEVTGSIPRPPVRPPREFLTDAVTVTDDSGPDGEARAVVTAVATLDTSGPDVTEQVRRQFQQVSLN